MELTDQFWMTFAAVLGANLLTVMFVIGLMKVHRDETEKGEGKSTALAYGAIAMPALFALFALYTTLY